MDEKKTSGKCQAVGQFIGFVILIAASVTGGWIACEMWPKGVTGPQQAPEQTVAVAAMDLKERLYNPAEHYVAHAEPEQEVDLLPQVDGYIKEMKFKEGDLVKAGDVLYVIDEERYQAVVNQRKADLAAAEAEARRAQRYFERMEKADARGITQLERDNSQADYEKAKASVLQAKANLVVAEYDLKKTVVHAPISGQIGKSSAYVGDYVAPSKGALAHIVQVDPIRVTFPMTDRAYIAFRQVKESGKQVDARMKLLLPDGTVYDQEGTWGFDDNEMSRETATIMMRLTFANPKRLLIPNSYVTLLMDRNNPPKYPCVPQQAIVDSQSGERTVWVVKKDLSVEERPVKTKETYAGWVPLTEGVKLGEKVVISGMGKLRRGVKVSLKEATDNDDLNPNYVSPVKE